MVSIAVADGHVGDTAEGEDQMAKDAIAIGGRNGRRVGVQLRDCGMQ